MDIQALNLPKAKLKLSRIDGVVYVWCILRKKNLVCTPEEWVRQHVIHFFISKGIPQGLIASEYKLEYNDRSKRADIVVFNRQSQAVLLVECKAPEIEINEKVLFQIASYNHQLQVQYLMLTNGLNHVYCSIDQKTGKFTYLEGLPDLFK